MCRPWGYLLLCIHIWERCHPGVLTRANIKNVSLAVLKPNGMRSRSGKIRFFISCLKQVFCKQDSNDQTVIQAEPFTLRNTWQSTCIIFFNAFSRGLLLAQAGCSIKCWPTTLNFSNFPFTKSFFFQASSPASSMVVHFWYMEVRRVGVRTFNMRTLSTRESNTRSVWSFSSSSGQRILLSMKEANICVSRKRDRKGK